MATLGLTTVEATLARFEKLLKDQEQKLDQMSRDLLELRRMFNKIQKGKN